MKFFFYYCCNGIENLIKLKYFGEVAKIKVQGAYYLLPLNRKYNQKTSKRVEIQKLFPDSRGWGKSSVVFSWGTVG